MSILSRLFRIGKSEANAAVDKLENAEKMADQVLREMRENLQHGLEGEAEIKASALQHRADELKSRHSASDWERKTNQLLDRVEHKQIDETEGNRLANESALKYQQFLNEADQYAAMAQKEEDALKIVDGKLSKIRTQIGDMEQKAKLLKSRSKTADVNEKINKTLSNVEVDGLVQTFQRMEEKVSAKEFKAQAYSEISDSTMSTEQEIDKVLSSGSSNALDAFKEKRKTTSTTN